MLLAAGGVLAAMAAVLACGAPPESMRETIARFRGVEHRIEFVDEIEGVRFYNDSKATSVDATLKALEALGEDAGKIVLLIGGRAGADYLVVGRPILNAADPAAAARAIAAEIAAA